MYKIEEFFDNYTQKKERNYKIYCVKYEQFWDNISLFNKVFRIPTFNLRPNFKTYACLLNMYHKYDKRRI